jgi:hypothetical protein
MKKTFETLKPTVFQSTLVKGSQVFSEVSLICHVYILRVCSLAHEGGRSLGGGEASSVPDIHSLWSAVLTNLQSSQHLSLLSSVPSPQLRDTLSGFAKEYELGYPLDTSEFIDFVFNDEADLRAVSEEFLPCSIVEPLLLAASAVDPNLYALLLSECSVLIRASDRDKSLCSRQSKLVLKFGVFRAKEHNLRHYCASESLLRAAVPSNIVVDQIHAFIAYLLRDLEVLVNAMMSHGIGLAYNRLMTLSGLSLAGELI